MHMSPAAVFNPQEDGKWQDDTTKGSPAGVGLYAGCAWPPVGWMSCQQVISAAAVAAANNATHQMPLAQVTPAMLPVHQHTRV